jgi:hypothetical protein
MAVQRQDSVSAAESQEETSRNIDNAVIKALDSGGIDRYNLNRNEVRRVVPPQCPRPRP